MGKISVDIERLKKCREKLGISKLEAGRRIGVDPSSYNRYESGKRTPSEQVLQVIADRFSTSVDYLTGKSDSNAPDFIIITKKDQPQLFEIIRKTKTMSESEYNKFISYLKKY